MKRKSDKFHSPDDELWNVGEVKDENQETIDHGKNLSDNIWINMHLLIVPMGPISKKQHQVVTNNTRRSLLLKRKFKGKTSWLFTKQDVLLSKENILKYYANKKLPENVG